jgi:hypothetical protein
MCAEHALPIGWEAMDYDTFLVERRQRMAEVIRIAFRKLGGEDDAPTLAPPWFLPGAEVVWQRIGETERALRAAVREAYKTTFGASAADRITERLDERQMEALNRAMRSRPAGADPLSIVDYLYLAQLPPLLFRSEVWKGFRESIGGDGSKPKLESAIQQIAPVRNEVAHVREVSADRLQRAHVACLDVLNMLRREGA